MTKLPEPKRRWGFFSCRAAAFLIMSFFAWEAPLGAQTTLFFEDFEGAFPGPWRVGDFEPLGFPAYWKDQPSGFGTVQPHAGGWMGYCAGVGYVGLPSF